MENWSQIDWNKMAYLQTVGYTPWWITPTPTSSELSGDSHSAPSHTSLSRTRPMLGCTCCLLSRVLSDVNDSSHTQLSVKLTLLSGHA